MPAHPIGGVGVGAQQVVPSTLSSPEGGTSGLELFVGNF